MRDEASVDIPTPALDLPVPDESKVAVAIAPALTRVMVEDTPSFYRLFGMVKVEECLPTLTIKGRTFYRSRSTPRWVLYKAAISGTGQTFDKGQR